MSRHTSNAGREQRVPDEFLQELYLEENEYPTDTNDDDVLLQEYLYEDEDEDAPYAGVDPASPGSDDVVEEYVVSQGDGELIPSAAAVIHARRRSGGRDEGAGPSTGLADPGDVDTRADHLHVIAERERMAAKDERTPDRVIGVRLGSVRDDENDEGTDGAQGRGCRSARGRGRGGRGATRAARLGRKGWRRGDRLIEIYPDDEDVPPAFRETMESLVRERIARQEARRQLVGKRERARRERSRGDHCRGTNVDDVDDDDMNEDLPVHQDFIRFCQDEEATDFKWEPMGTFRGAKEAFVGGSGPTQHHANGYDTFRRIWTDGFLEQIASETNRYASTIPQSEERFHDDWYPTNSHEILLLFAFWMMLGIIQMPTIASCFSLHPLLKMDVFRKLFSSRRYWGLNRALHFADVSEGDSDRLNVLRPVIDHLNSKFQQLYVPDQHICIDESLTLWKGPLNFRQYIKTKAAKFGIKTFELCESSTGYLWSFFIYTGKDVSEVVSVQKSTLQVLKLIWPLLGKGYTLFMDNYFNSPLLARFLKRHNTDVVGTLRNARSDVPRLISDVQLKEGHYVARHSGDVVVGNFHDKKPVRLISTYHNMDQSLTDPTPGKFRQHKLNLVKDYNVGMGGVDLKDGTLQAHNVERKQCLNWYMKMFKRLLNVSVQNSRILVEKSNNIKCNNLTFRLGIVDAIMENHLKLRPKIEQPSRRQFTSMDPARFICRPDRFHTPVKYINPAPSTSVSCVRTTNRRRCIFCRPNAAQTSYECNICKVPLCLETCFLKYHTESH